MKQNAPGMEAGASNSPHMNRTGGGSSCFTLEMSGRHCFSQVIRVSDASDMMNVLYVTVEMLFCGVLLPMTYVLCVTLEMVFCGVLLT